MSKKNSQFDLDDVLSNNIGEAPINCTCPIHGGTGVNFSYYPKSQRWCCYSMSCENLYGNDLIGLVSGILGISRDEAKKKTQNSIIKNVFKKKPQSKPTKIFPSNILINKNHDIKLFTERGFSVNTLEHFKVFECKEPRKSMYNRAVVPVFNANYEIVGFTGRTLGKSKNKWKHVGFRTGKIIYNIQNAINNNRNNTIILVEGPVDVWRLYEAGIYNVGAILGMNISSDQIKLLKQSNFTTVVLILDPDYPAMGKIMQPGGLFDKLSDNFRVINARHVLSNDPGDVGLHEINKRLKPFLENIYAK